MRAAPIAAPSLLCAALVAAPLVSAAQAPSAERELSGFEELEDLDLAELLDLDIRVVSATKLSTSLNEAPSIVTVVTKEDIRRWGYRTVAEALERTLGFYLVDDHVTPNVAVRGVTGGLRAESSIVKVMIDGHPVAYRPTNGNWLGAELVPIGAIEQIEIIRGPASALYGADAFMGVVNIITKSGKAADGADVRASGILTRDENLGVSIDAVGGQTFGDFQVLAGARYDREDRAGLSLPDSSPAPNLPAGAGASADALGLTSASGYLRMSYDVSDRTYVRLGGYFSLQQRDAAFAEWAQLTASGDDAGTQVDRYNSAVLANASWGVSDSFTLTLDATTFFGGDRGSSRIDVASPDFLVRQQQSFLGTDVQLGGVWQVIDDLTVVVGAGIIVDAETLGQTDLLLRSAPDAPQSVDPGVDQTFVNPGLLAQATYKAVDQYLTLTGGVRYDYHNIYGNQVSGRFGAVSNPLPGVYLKALYGSAFKAPSPVLLYGRPAQSGDIIGNPDLAPQYVHTVEGQIIYQPTPSLSFGTNLAYSYVQDLAVFSRSGFNSVARNVAELGTVSWESYAQASFRQWVGGYLRYEMLFSERYSGDEGFQSALLDQGSGVFPDLQLRAGVWGQIPAAYLKATVEVRYVGERRASDLNVLANNGAYSLDPYFVLDATLATVGLELFGEGRESAVELIGRNLTGADAAFPGEAGVDYPILPRTLFLQLRQEL